MQYAPRVLHFSAFHFHTVSTDDAVTDAVNFPPSTSILGKGITSRLHHSPLYHHCVCPGVLEGNVVLFSTTHGVISVHLSSPLPPTSTSSSSQQPHTRYDMYTLHGQNMVITAYWIVHLLFMP